jgi:hypothetical protein
MQLYNAVNEVINNRSTRSCRKAEHELATYHPAKLCEETIASLLRNKQKPSAVERALLLESNRLCEVKGPFLANGPFRCERNAAGALSAFFWRTVCRVQYMRIIFSAVAVLALGLTACNLVDSKQAPKSTENVTYSYTCLDSAVGGSAANKAIGRTTALFVI